MNKVQTIGKEAYNAEQVEKRQILDRAKLMEKKLKEKSSIDLKLRRKR